jgi:hypothetical protein
MALEQRAARVPTNEAAQRTLEEIPYGVLARNGDATPWSISVFVSRAPARVSPTHMGSMEPPCEEHPCDPERSDQLSHTQTRQYAFPAKYNSVAVGEQLASEKPDQVFG